MVVVKYEYNRRVINLRVALPRAFRTIAKLNSRHSVVILSVKCK